MSKAKLYPASGGLPEFVLTRKNIRRIHLRVDDEGCVQISAPVRVPLADVRGMISGHIEWINKMKKLREQKHASRPRARNGGGVMICGHVYPLTVAAGGRNTCRFTADRTGVAVTAAEPENEELVTEILERFLRKQAQSLFEQSLQRMYPLLKDFKPPFPALKIRKMTSRWGSCNVKTNVITLNLCLARANMEIIDSVVLHELIHLVNFPHDKRFHTISAALMPDYKIRSKELNSLDIIY